MLVVMEPNLASRSIIYVVCFDDMNNVYSVCTRAKEVAGIQSSLRLVKVALDGAT